MMSREFIAFVAAGGTSAVINWLSRIGLSEFMRLEYAVTIAYLIGMSIAYTLNKLFVFQKSGRNVSDEYIRFTIVNMVALVQVLIVTVGLERVVFPLIGFDWYSDEVAHAIGVGSPIVTSYIGHRHFTFSKKQS